MRYIYNYYLFTSTFVGGVYGSKIAFRKWGSCDMIISGLIAGTALGFALPFIGTVYMVYKIKKQLE